MEAKLSPPKGMKYIRPFPAEGMFTASMETRLKRFYFKKRAEATTMRTTEKSVQFKDNEVELAGEGWHRFYDIQLRGMPQNRYIPCEEDFRDWFLYMLGIERLDVFEVWDDKRQLLERKSSLYAKDPSLQRVPPKLVEFAKSYQTAGEPIAFLLEQRKKQQDPNALEYIADKLVQQGLPHAARHAEHKAKTKRFK